MKRLQPDTIRLDIYAAGSNLARKVIKLEDELQKLSSELKQSISGLNVHQSTQSSSEDQPSQCNSVAHAIKCRII